MDPLKRIFLLETIISRFHVNFWGCIYNLSFFCLYPSLPVIPAQVWSFEVGFLGLQPQGLWKPRSSSSSTSRKVLDWSQQRDDFFAVSRFYHGMHQNHCETRTFVAVELVNRHEKPTIWGIFFGTFFPTTLRKSEG